jgi:hypothetical protein
MHYVPQYSWHVIARSPALSYLGYVETDLWSVGLLSTNEASVRTLSA